MSDNTIPLVSVPQSFEPKPGRVEDKELSGKSTPDAQGAGSWSSYRISSLAPTATLSFYLLF